MSSLWCLPGAKDSASEIPITSFLLRIIDTHINAILEMSKVAFCILTHFLLKISVLRINLILLRKDEIGKTVDKIARTLSTTI